MVKMIHYFTTLASVVFHALILFWAPSDHIFHHHDLSFADNPSTALALKVKMREDSSALVPIPAPRPTPTPPSPPPPQKKRPRPKKNISRGVQDFQKAILTQTPPLYPRLALRRNWEGSVLLKLHIGTQGKVVDIEILRPAHHNVFNKSALAAAWTWNFRPPKGDDKYFVLKEITFLLQDP